MKNTKPTREQVKEFWMLCGFKWQHKKGTLYYEWYYQGELIGDTLPIDFKNLFRYAVPAAIKKLEGRFDATANVARGLELLFAKWIDKIYQEYPLEDALFWAIREEMLT